MNRENTERGRYGNWVSKPLLYIPGTVALLSAILSFVWPLLIVVAILFAVFLAYFAYAYYRFSPAGGDIQARIRNLVLDRLEWSDDGKALDIGYGNGALVIGLAKRCPRATVTGIDFWGKRWGYSKEACERNAVIEGVADRTVFRKANAASLPFDDQSFDAAISNLTFHEVRDARDKKTVIREALRVVKEDGVFAFQDLFLYKSQYGEIDDLLSAIRSWGVRDVGFVDTSSESFVPVLLRPRFMVGSMGIIWGTK